MRRWFLSFLFIIISIYLAQDYYLKDLSVIEDAEFQKQIERIKMASPTPKLRAVVLGGTGAIGKKVVSELVASDSFVQVTTLGRREVPLSPELAKSDKLTQVIVDMENLDNYKKDVEGHDVAFCCLGTTRSDAGSAEAFRHVDYDMVVNFSRIAKESGVKHMNLVSSVGANPHSWFLYPKTKGQSEEALKELNFERLSIFRPGLLDREGEARTVEKFAGVFMSKIPVLSVAKAMKVTALQQARDKLSKRVDVYENSQIKEIAKYDS